MSTLLESQLKGRQTDVLVRLVDDSIEHARAAQAQRERLQAQREVEEARRQAASEQRRRDEEQIEADDAEKLIQRLAAEADTIAKETQRRRFEALARDHRANLDLVA